MPTTVPLAERRRLHRPRALLLALTAALALPTVLTGVPAEAASRIVDVPITFQVVNRNTSPVPCPIGPDGQTYTVHGTLVAPRAVLSSKAPAATLYLHGLGYSGELFYRFSAVPGYDFARSQAEAGHATVVVDRLGNPAQDELPDGNATCLPAQADLADQMVDALRTGAYRAQGGATSFDRVLLAGHSAGGLITEFTQAYFGSADAIAILGSTDFPSPLALQTFAAAGQDCLTAPQHARGAGGAANYAPFGRTDADFAAGHVHNMDPAVETVVLRDHSLDACGDLLSGLHGLGGNQLGSAAISVPVLMLSGDADALFSPPTNQLRAATAFPSSPEVTLVELADTGHAVTLGRSAGAFRAAMQAWLTDNGA